MTLYRPSYPFGAAGWAVVQSLSDLVFAAIHKITPYSGKSQRPRTIPETAFEELGITSVSELAITQLQCQPNYLSTLASNSLEDLRLALNNFQQFLRRVIVWIASCINHSVSKGFEAPLNWGAFIGLKWEDFLFCISPATVIAEACKHSITTEEVYAYYETDDTSSLTRYIPNSPVYYPDIAAYIHFPYHPQYSRMDFFNSLPCLITNYLDDSISMTSTLVSPTLKNNEDIKMKDQAIEDITVLMGDLVLR